MRSSRGGNQVSVCAGNPDPGDRSSWRSTTTRSIRMSRLLLWMHVLLCRVRSSPSRRIGAIPGARCVSIVKENGPDILRKRKVWLIWTARPGYMSSVTLTRISPSSGQIGLTLPHSAKGLGSMLLTRSPKLVVQTRSPDVKYLRLRSLSRPSRTRYGRVQVNMTGHDQTMRIFF